MKPSPHFVDLTTISCVIGRVFDRGWRSFIDRSRSTAHVKMASLPSSSQGSDVTDFSTSNKLDLELVSLLEKSLMSVSSTTDGAAMDLDTSPTDSLE